MQVNNLLLKTTVGISCGRERFYYQPLETKVLSSFCKNVQYVCPFFVLRLYVCDSPLVVANRSWPLRNKSLAGYIHEVRVGLLKH